MVTDPHLWAARDPVSGCAFLSDLGGTLWLSGSEDQMRTYDPADHIVYVHLGQQPAVRAEPPHVRDECHRLPAGYANVSLRARISEPRTVSARPELVLLPGGSPAAGRPASAASALRLAQ